MSLNLGNVSCDMANVFSPVYYRLLAFEWAKWMDTCWTGKILQKIVCGQVFLDFICE